MVETLTDAQLDQLTELYIAYFNRAPENAGLSFHADAVIEDLNAGTSFADALLERADQFFDAAIAAPEFSGYSDADTAEEFVTTMYSNVLGRPGPGGDAPTAAELSFWADQVEAGTLSRGDLVLRFLSDTKDLANNPLAPEQAAAQQVVALLQNRVDVAREFAKPENSAGLSGEAAFNAGVSALALVTADPDSVAAAIATFAGQGNTIELTSGTDAGLAFVGTTGDDVFNANLEQTAFLPIQTLNSTDDINGGLGHDTLNVQLRDAFTSPAGINGIEEVNINGEPGLILPFLVPNTLDVLNADSIETLGFNNIQSPQTVINIGTAVDTVNISNDFGSFLELDHIGTALDGAADELTVNLSNADGTVLDTDGGYETVTVNSSGPLPNSLFLDTVNPATVNVTGDQDLRLRGDALDSDTVDLIDATSFTGDLDVRTFGTGEVTIEGGSGDDTLRVGGDAIAIVNGNDGNDEIRVGPGATATATGGEGDDTFRFNSVGGPGDPLSFTTADSVDGGAGINTLIIENDDDETLGAGVGAGIVNIDRIVHTDTGGGTAGNITVDMSESGSAMELGIGRRLR